MFFCHKREVDFGEKTISAFTDHVAADPMEAACIRCFLTGTGEILQLVKRILNYQYMAAEVGRHGVPKDTPPDLPGSFKAMTNEPKLTSNTQGERPDPADRRLLCAVHDFLDLVEDVPFERTLDVLFDAVVANMAEAMARDNILKGYFEV